MNPDFWMKKDDTSMARSLRLAMIVNVYDQGGLTKEQAEECLKTCLSPGDEGTRFDDSAWLEWNPDGARKHVGGLSPQAKELG